MQDLDQAILVIRHMDRNACLDKWREVFGRSPPKHLSIHFIKRVLIWEFQNRIIGRVSKKTACRLQQISAGKTVKTCAKPGSHLIRDWNGRTYQVEVVADGYVMEGKTWRSLSALARYITGARWSGPRFFGVG